MRFFIICPDEVCWKIVCLVLHLETFFVRKEDVGRWGRKLVLDCWISALPETARKAGLIIGRLLFFT